MVNLFSVFDPVAISGWPLNWLSPLIVLMAIFPLSFWSAKSQINLTFKTLQHSLYKEFKPILGASNFPGTLTLATAVFSFIWLNNFWGLSPYTFTATSHLSLTLAVGLPLWLGHTLLASFKMPQHMLAHLVPLGSPAYLAPFMVAIELISAIIRPITLSVRLAANMVAGHLLMVLLSAPSTTCSSPLTSIIIASLVFLVILELAVATIQAYVFSILSVLYVSEVNTPKMA